MLICRARKRVPWGYQLLNYANALCTMASDIPHSQHYDCFLDLYWSDPVPQTLISPVSLGDEVKDRVTGFTGIVMSLHFYFNRCIRATLQPEGLDEGKVKSSEAFDVEQLEIISPAKVAQKPDRGADASGVSRNPNGPMDIPARPAI